MVKVTRVIFYGTVQIGKILDALNMATPITSILNLGPETAELFAKHGLKSAEEVIGLGADQAHAHLLNAGMRPHFIGYYALVMGLQGRPWNNCQGAEKDALRRKFDNLKTKSYDADREAFEVELAKIGILEPGCMPPKRT